MKPSALSVAALANHVGSNPGEACGSIDLVADRRGSTVYRLQFPTGDVALIPSEVTYRGGMVHFTAPETAAQILAISDNQPIVIDEIVEVYALAAVFHLAWTGLPPTAYTHDQPSLRDKLKDVVHGRQHDPAAIRPWPWPAFENALRHALRPEPENRIPSMTRFRDVLIAEHIDL